MTTYAPHHDTARDARIREAWSAYRDGTRGPRRAASTTPPSRRPGTTCRTRCATIAEAHAAATAGGRDAGA